MIEQNAWYPVARLEELAPRHVFHTALQGYEVAIWRSDDDEVNVWENRCPHRSVRLTLGINTGQRLRCQYHGWQYRSGDGRCTDIPATQDRSAPARLCTRSFPVRQVDGLVWTRFDSPLLGDEPSALSSALRVSLRSRTIHADPERVMAALSDYAALDPSHAADSVILERQNTQLEVRWQGEQAHHVGFWLQPVSEGKTVVHAACAENARGIAGLRRWHDALLGRLVRRVESAKSAAAEQNTQPQHSSHLIPLKVLPGLPMARPGLIHATVHAIHPVAEDILAFELLPEQPLNFEPGAHIDVHTPAGLVRQYSLINAPDERDHLLIAVKRDPASRGGSRTMHENVAVGDQLTISLAKNHFPLRADKPALLIAGGIGITPILAMGARLQQAGTPYTLHYFARNQNQVAFTERLKALEGTRFHLGLDPQQTRLRLESALRETLDGSHLYVCGPEPLIELARQLAAEQQIDEDRIHFELFANQMTQTDQQPFQVRLGRSGEEFEVPAGVTLAEALLLRGIDLETSCEQGVCGTCRVGVTDGEPDHRDLYLSDKERLSGSCILPCVSRSRSDLLVLDL